MFFENTMLDKPFQKQKSKATAKCVKCGKSAPTKEDNMCDSCRFMLALESIIKTKE